MDNPKHQFTLECYSKMAKAREDLRSLLDVIGLPIEALCIDASRQIYSVRASDVVEELKASGLPHEKKDSLVSLIKNFKQERGQYGDSLISLAFDIIGAVSTLRNEAHDIEAITHVERNRMRLEGTALRDFSDMVDNKGKYKRFARTSLSMFKDTFREAFKRSAHYSSHSSEFMQVPSGDTAVVYYNSNEDQCVLQVGKRMFAKRQAKHSLEAVYHIPRYWYQHCIKKNMHKLWRDSDNYTVIVSGKIWMPLTLKEVEHPYYSDEPHRVAYKCKLLRVQDVKSDSSLVSAEIREGWLVADVRDGSKIVMAFNEDFRKADRQLSTKVTTDVVDNLDI
tara:strand:- start:551 stop:1558 length:1008 start_codon:yes stop_codon:yes gene_type:complete